jgi:lipopolysaccharide transport system ATP-binding protein
MNEIGQLVNISKYYSTLLEVFKSTLLGLEQRFVKSPVLYPISFSIHRSEVIGIIGRNGAGKSTLLKLISGILKPSTGTLNIEGRIASLLELGSGFNPNFTGRENIYIYSNILGYSQKKISQEMNYIINFSGLSKYIDEPLRTYSSGMVARLAFTVATTVEPDIIIIDEVLSVGDSEFRLKSFNKIKSLQEKGVTIIFCSHSLYQIELLCSTVLWLEKGQVMFCGDPQEGIAQYRDFISAEPLNTKKYSKLKQIDQPSFIKKVYFYKNGSPFKESEYLKSEEDSLQIKVKFAHRDETIKPSVSISFSLIDGPIICGIGSFEDSIQTYVKNGKGSISLYLNQINLLKGIYSVNINLMNDDGTVCLDSVIRARTIKVRQNSLKQGYALLNHEWTSP